MKKTAPNAFTLIELLVVIAIMAIVGVFTLANYRSFGEDQNLKNAVLDIQSQLRTAQTNATTNVKCGTQFGATWQVYFSGSTTIYLQCRIPGNVRPSLIKTLQLGTNIGISRVQGSFCPGLPFTISFDLLTGKINFGDPRCTSLTITLQNSKTRTTKSLIIEQGGRIYAP